MAGHAPIIVIPSGGPAWNDRRLIQPVSRFRPQAGPRQIVPAASGFTTDNTENKGRTESWVGITIWFITPEGREQESHEQLDEIDRFKPELSASFGNVWASQPSVWCDGDPRP